MSKLAALLLVALVATAHASEFFLDQNKIDAINAEADGWTAGMSDYFLHRSEKEVVRLMGYKDGGERLPERKPFTAADLAAVPASFSWTDRGIVGAVRNQGSCGSCWVFGGVEALSDRMRIAGHNVNASATDPVACDSGWFSGGNGCEGGQPSQLWQYLKSSGSVDTHCAPYLTSQGGPIPTCPPEKQPCLNFVPTPSCNKTCVNGHSWSGSKLYAETIYSVSSDVNQIMAEIYNHGPVEGAFSVYSDFPGYKSGVYRRSSSATYLGGHAIEIVGYGTENGTPYWYVRNSWTTTWGDQGYFKILRGSNECGIEGDIVAGLPKL